jgi:hypothetical protein
MRLQLAYRSKTAGPQTASFRHCGLASARLIRDFPTCAHSFDATTSIRLVSSRV